MEYFITHKIAFMNCNMFYSGDYYEVFKSYVDWDGTNTIRVSRMNLGNNTTELQIFYETEASFDEKLKRVYFPILDLEEQIESEYISKYVSNVFVKWRDAYLNKDYITSDKYRKLYMEAVSDPPKPNQTSVYTVFTEALIPYVKMLAYERYCAEGYEMNLCDVERYNKLRKYFDDTEVV